MLNVSSADEEHDYGNRNDEKYRSEVRLQGQEEHDRSKQGHIGEKSSFEGMYFRPSPLKEVREIQYGRQFYEFDRLEGKRKERNVDPSSRAVVHDPDEQNDDKRNQA